MNTVRKKITHWSLLIFLVIGTCPFTHLFGMEEEEREQPERSWFQSTMASTQQTASSIFTWAKRQAAVTWTWLKGFGASIQKALKVEKLPSDGKQLLSTEEYIPRTEYNHTEHERDVGLTKDAYKPPQQKSKPLPPTRSTKPPQKSALSTTAHSEVHTQKTSQEKQEKALPKEHKITKEEAMRVAKKLIALRNGKLKRETIEKYYTLYFKSIIDNFFHIDERSLETFKQRIIKNVDHKFQKRTKLRYKKDFIAFLDDAIHTVVFKFSKPKEKVDREIKRISTATKIPAHKVAQKAKEIILSKQSLVT